MPAGESGVGAPSSVEPRERVLARELCQVDAQIERRRRQAALGRSPRLPAAPYSAVRRSHSQSGRSACTAAGKFAARDRLDARDEFRIPVQRASRKAEHAHQRGDGQIARRRAARGRLQRTLAPQHREHRLRDERAVLLAEIAMAAEVGRQRLVGGTRELQQFGRARSACASSGRVSASLQRNFRRQLVEARAVLVDDEDAHRQVIAGRRRARSRSTLSCGLSLRLTSLSASNSPAGVFTRSRPAGCIGIGGHALAVGHAARSRSSRGGAKANVHDEAQLVLALQRRRLGGRIEIGACAFRARCACPRTSRAAGRRRATAPGCVRFASPRKREDALALPGFRGAVGTRRRAPGAGSPRRGPVPLRASS